MDSGTQCFSYDQYGNLEWEDNDVLRSKGSRINYEYDGFDRLLKIDYPDSIDVVNTYGTRADGENAIGKIIRKEDETGSTEYSYGKLGDVREETRTIVQHCSVSSESLTYTMSYTSDYLGRMQEIVYPDGESVCYEYDDGGQVTGIKGKHGGTAFDYVSDIGYDEFGQRVYIEYGNGVRTDYVYDEARRWLSSIETRSTRSGVLYQNIRYKFSTVGDVMGYTNDCLEGSGTYSTEQRYTYDALHQLTSVTGTSIDNRYRSASEPTYTATYSQKFTFDTEGLGRMMSKVSTASVSPNRVVGDDLNYTLDYVYDDAFSHRLVRAGDRYYDYDLNGNVVCEHEEESEDDETSVMHKVTEEGAGVYGTDYGWALKKESTGTKTAASNRYRREYQWNERNLMTSSVDNSYTVNYGYGSDGQRAFKYTDSSETLYFNTMWSWHYDAKGSTAEQVAKNIYLGETRIVTKLNRDKNGSIPYEQENMYFYHSDHLGSAQLITDYQGEEYQRLEYTPYGEIWIEKTSNTGNKFLPYKFTGKEMDEETGLYYYGARYLDPKYSRWLSTAPALGEYIPAAPTSEEASRNNSNLPGMGGVFNHINCDLYHYAGNNPVRYIDPDGNDILAVTSRQYQNSSANNNLDIGSEQTGFYNRQNKYINNTVGRFGCLFVCAVNIGNSYNQAHSSNYGEQPVSSLACEDKYFNFFLSRTDIGTDFASGPSQIKQLLKDMTGTDFNVLRISHRNLTAASIEAINSEVSKSSYIIADVGGHFINITGIDSDGNIEYFDPYIRNTPKNYTMKDVKGAYFIMEMESYKRLVQQNENQ